MSLIARNSSSEFLRSTQGLGCAWSPNTQKALDELHNPVHRVAVIGDFQVGKTTLINKVFLKSDALLTEGDGMVPTSSVCTRIMYGSRKKLIVVPRQVGKETVDVGGQSIEIEVASAGIPKEISDPTADQIKAYSSAKDEAGRSKLAEEIDELRVEWPAEGLRKYEIFDTPGLNDVNTQMLHHTTYRVVPQSHMVVILVEPRQLAQNVIQFLKGSVFKGGISKAVILISYKPQRSAVDGRQIAALVENMGNTLADYGLQVPVAAYTYDASVDLPLNSAEKVESWLQARLAEGAGAAKQEKVENLLRAELAQEASRLRNTIALAGPSQAAQRDAMARTLADAKRKGESEHATLWLGLNREFKALAGQEAKALASELSVLERKKLDELVEVKSHAELQAVVERLKTGYPDELRQGMCAGIDRFKNSAMALAQANASLHEYAKAIPDVDAPIVEMGLAGKFAALPPMLLLAADMLICEFILPGGAVANLLERVLLPRMPIVGKFFGKITPSALLTSLAKSQLEASVRTILSGLVSTLPKLFESEAEKLGAVLEGALEKMRTERLANLERSLADAGQADQSKIDLMRSELVRIEAVLAK